MKIINETGNLKIFESDFINAMLEEYWSKVYNKLFWRVFIPHIIYMVLIHVYLMTVLDHFFRYERQLDPWINVKRYIFGVLALYSWAYQLYIEYLQAKASGLR